MSTEDFLREFERAYRSKEPERWQLDVIIRMAVDASWWCLAQVVVLWLFSFLSTGRDVQRQSVILLVSSCLVYLFCRGMGTHIQIAVGRAIAVGLLFATIAAQVAKEMR